MVLAALSKPLRNTRVSFVCNLKFNKGKSPISPNDESDGRTTYSKLFIPPWTVMMRVGGSTIQTCSSIDIISCKKGLFDTYVPHTVLENQLTYNQLIKKIFFGKRCIRNGFPLSPAVTRDIMPSDISHFLKLSFFSVPLPHLSNSINHLVAVKITCGSVSKDSRQYWALWGWGPPKYIFLKYFCTQRNGYQAHIMRYWNQLTMIISFRPLYILDSG